jgi:hypothetical protein
MSEYSFKTNFNKFPNKKGGPYKFARPNPIFLNEKYYKQQGPNIRSKEGLNPYIQNPYLVHRTDVFYHPDGSHKTPRERLSSYYDNKEDSLVKEIIDEYDKDSRDYAERKDVIASVLRQGPKVKAKRRAYFDKLMGKSDFQDLPNDVLADVYKMMGPSNADALKMKEVGGNGLKPYQVKGSPAAKARMKALRALRRTKV